MKLKTKTIAIAALGLIALVVFLQNTESVETRILFFTISMPRALLLLSSLIVGALIGVALTTFLRRDKSDEDQ